jgi:superfamily I DNA and/or RNA helicase
LGLFLSPRFERQFCGENFRIAELIVDETSQLPIYKALPIIYRLVPSLEKVAFFGDRTHLPPFGDDGEESAVTSALESFVVAGGSPNFLEIQYRVPSPIAQVLSDISYGGRLRAWEEKIIPISDCLMWIDVAGEQIAAGGSRSNVAEATAISDMVRNLGILKAETCQRQFYRSTLPNWV